MTQWYYYVKDDGTGYWSCIPPHASFDRYLAYVYADQMPTGAPNQSTQP